MARVKQNQLDDEVPVRGAELGGKRPLGGAPAACRTVLVPTAAREYETGLSSKRKLVHIPQWCEVDGVRYFKLAAFPNTHEELSSHAGAHGCVAAFEAECLSQAAHQGLPSRLALKCVPYGLKRKGLESPWASEWRIHRFLRTLSGAAQNAVVSCLGGVTTTISRQRQVFFALELVDTDLFTMIERSANVPDFGLWILKALHSTALSLHVLHASGIVYCDLKPENVLVSKIDGQAKFGDFDRSCVPGLNLGVVGGTKGYYSPERMDNSGIHTEADDAWAFGVLLLIGATTAASPYLDYDSATVYKFNPAVYMRKYTRCQWSPVVLDRMCTLAEELLRVDSNVRAPVALAVNTIASILSDHYGIHVDSLPQNNLVPDFASPVPTPAAEDPLLIEEECAVDVSNLVNEPQHIRPQLLLHHLQQQQVLAQQYQQHYSMELPQAPMNPMAAVVAAAAVAQQQQQQQQALAHQYQQLQPPPCLTHSSATTVTLGTSMPHMRFVPQLAISCSTSSALSYASSSAATAPFSPRGSPARSASTLMMQPLQPTSLTIPPTQSLLQAVDHVQPHPSYCKMSFKRERSVSGVVPSDAQYKFARCMY